MDERSRQQEETDRARQARAERNRQRALLLRQAKLAALPVKSSATSVVVGASKLFDGGGGFFTEEGPGKSGAKPFVPDDSRRHARGDFDPARCRECDKEFCSSYLLDHFDEPTCDACRDPDEKHSLMTKTEAKELFLLRDADLDEREPALPRLSKSNPRNATWGRMHLFLKSQVEARAMEVWETAERLEEEKRQRKANKERLRQKRFRKNVQDLRKNVRSSTRMAVDATHRHDYGEECDDVEEGFYFKICRTCDHRLTYEKM